MECWERIRVWKALPETPLQASSQATDDVIRVTYRTEAKGVIGTVGGVSSREGTMNEERLQGQVQKGNQLAVTQGLLRLEGTLGYHRVDTCQSQVFLRTKY